MHKSKILKAKHTPIDIENIQLAERSQIFSD